VIDFLHHEIRNVATYRRIAAFLRSKRAVLVVGYKKKPLILNMSGSLNQIMVGTRGFEPPTP
jgi:hypothetical protein